MKKINRRHMIAASGGILGGSLFGLPTIDNNYGENIQRKMKVMVVGGHPDDPESCCGGTICKLTSIGHEVHAVYLTRGEAGLKGTSFEEAAKIRTEESLESCKLMNATPYFFGQIDGNTLISNGEFEKMTDLIAKENPEMVVTHWPIDAHPDHRAASNLVYNAWNVFRNNTEKAFDLYYFEALTGSQTQNFHPTHYIDITEVANLKKEATLKHVCQKPEEWYWHHEKMSEFRALESGADCKYAEAFIRQSMSRIF